MAGGNPPKSSLQKPSSSSASSSHRKSRWESSNSKNDNTTTNNNNANSNKKSPAEPKASDAKPPKPSTNPSPKTKPIPSPAQTKHPADPTPHSGHAGIPSPGASFPFPDGPPPPPAYGFHMLERRTIVLADGSVRSYFALPPDYQDFTPLPRPIDPAGRLLSIGPAIDPVGFEKRFPPGGPVSPGRFRLDDQFGQGRHQDYWNSLGLDGRGAGEGSAKRKYGDEDNKDRRDERDELARQRQQLLHDANSNAFLRRAGGERGDFSVGASGALKRDLMDAARDAEFRASKYLRVGGAYENVGFRQGGGVGDNLIHKHLEVDQDALKKAFLHFVKAINENALQKKKYLEDGKQGRLQCVACGRSSKDFPDMHALIMHTYYDNTDSVVDHLGLHKALCVLMGWNYSKPPDNSKTYQLLSTDEAVANQEDLVMWPPLVIIHNTITGKGRDGRMEGMGNKTMDNNIRDLGFGGGKAKSLYGKEGHLGITLVKFSGDQTGLKEAVRLAEHFEMENHGRKAWALLQPLTLGKDDENNLNLVRLDEKKGEKKRVLYGYLGTAFDLDKVDFDTRKKVSLESRKEYKPSN